MGKTATSRRLRGDKAVIVPPLDGNDQWTDLLCNDCGRPIPRCQCSYCFKRYNDSPSGATHTRCAAWAETSKRIDAGRATKGKALLVTSGSQGRAFGRSATNAKAAGAMDSASVASHVLNRQVANPAPLTL